MKAHEELIKLIEVYPELEIIWRPCESHPRPDTYRPHTDLCIQGMFYALDFGTDLWAYHERVYRAALKERVNVEDAYELANVVGDLLDPDSFRSAILEGRYKEAQENANNYAFSKSGVWVVPAYRMNDRKLDAVENIGITRDKLIDFLGKEK